MSETNSNRKDPARQKPRPFSWFPTFLHPKLWRWIAAVVLGLVTLTVLFYTVENLRGKWAWHKTKEQLQEQGESLDFRDLVPPLPAEHENLAMAEPFRKLLNANGKLGRGTNEEFLSAWHDNQGVYLDWETDAEREQLNQQFGLELKDSDRKTILDPGSPPLNAPSTAWDFKEWEIYYRLIHQQTTNNRFAKPDENVHGAEAVLQALSGQNETWEQIQSACQRPKAVWPVQYEKGIGALLPHLSKLKAISQFCKLKAAAHLEVQQNEKAFETIQTGICLTESLKEPILISQLVRYAMWHILAVPIKTGLLQHSWTETQLHAMATQLEPINLLDDYQHSLRGERAIFLTQTMVRGDFADIFDSGSDPNDWEYLFFGELLQPLFPKGWIHQNAKVTANLYQQIIEQPDHIQERRIDPSEALQVAEAIEQVLKKKSVFTILANAIIPAYDKALKKTAQAQTLLHLTTVAIYLELYYFDRNQYPPSLDELQSFIKKPLPGDVTIHHPLRYRPLKDGQFYELYSVGWNENDDGGEREEMLDIVWTAGEK